MENKSNKSRNISRFAVTRLLGLYFNVNDPISQSDAAKIIGITPANFSNARRGVSSLTLASFVEILFHIYRKFGADEVSSLVLNFIELSDEL